MDAKTKRLPSIRPYQIIFMLCIAALPLVYAVATNEPIITEIAALILGAMLGAMLARHLPRMFVPVIRKRPNVLEGYEWYHGLILIFMTLMVFSLAFACMLWLVVLHGLFAGTPLAVISVLVTPVASAGAMVYSFVNEFKPKKWK